ncbi:zinc finger protein NUTCRACKER-like [Iris pallida]|uniref:Protein EARLY HEADING DATE 2 n=1 Tax=Iris pallida TaxID=29817 RepID=A0AAX6GE15_IRIPA|nr:zinc finger protein NUTCRACKER-like [Iris pallida]
MAFSENPDQKDSNPLPAKKKRSLPGTPDPEAEVVSLSPKTLMVTNRFLCEVCGKGFQRDQNLQLHRRGHNLPWKLRQRITGTEPRKRVYVCPEKGCVHSHPSRALGDLTGIKKHFCRKHGEKKWKCDKCSKRYAVQSDWKAHSKTCGTREYRCDCGTIFSRRDSFITHRAFCDALAEETARVCSFNYQFTGGQTQHQPPGGFGLADSSAVAGDQGIPGLSLWMGQGPSSVESLSSNNHHAPAHALPNLHPIDQMNIGSLMLYGSDPYGPVSNNAQQILDHQLSWLYGITKLSSPSSGELTSVSLPASSSTKESVSSNSLLESVPSLYSSTQHQQQRHLSPSDMSATALLQRAALIGATISAVPSFPMRSCFDTNFYDVDQASQDHGSSKFDGFYNPSEGSDHLGSNLENSPNDFALSTNPYFMDQMAVATVTRKLFHETNDDHLGGETRDFLGIGAQSLCASLYQWMDHRVD